MVILLYEKVYNAREGAEIKLFPRNDYGRERDKFNRKSVEKMSDTFA